MAVKQGSTVNHVLEIHTFFFVCFKGSYFISTQVHVKRDKVTWPGAIIQKNGEGMPNYDNNKVRGTLFITVDVEFPRGTLPEDTREGVCVFT